HQRGQGVVQFRQGRHGSDRDRGVAHVPRERDLGRRAPRGAEQRHGAELLPEASGADALPVPVNPMWGDAARFAELRLLRERLELLELLVRSGIELDSRQLCELLELRRLPPTQSWEGGSQGFERQGLRFVRHQRPGQRTGWRTVRP
ncbi:MAG: hypothetical protein EBS42_16545, partial [Caulobacteraceae bacterium]|nr:hypothetical protein [Caulobacteraceae bacterium]